MLEVVDPGLLSTIQDAGRPWAADQGVPRGGACDPLALRVLEQLVGGPAGSTAALEITLAGPELAVRETCVIGLSGADLECEVTEERRPLRPGTTALVRAGTTLRFGAARDGCRAYLSLAGGIDVPLVLGSRSTCSVGGFGGIDGEGRPIRAGDLLRPMKPGALGLAGRRWPGRAGGSVGASGSTVVRVVAGPHLDRFPKGSLEGLRSNSWEVSGRSDRMGIRLDGSALPVPARPDLVSIPVTWGAVQVPPSGQPIVLLADHQTVGGYPIVAVVASVDRPVLGQLRAGDAVRFEVVEAVLARRLKIASDAIFDADAAMFRTDASDATAG